MVVSVAPKIFQEKVNHLFHGFGHIQAYLDGVLLKTKNNLYYQLVEIESLILRLT